MYSKQAYEAQAQKPQRAKTPLVESKTWYFLLESHSNNYKDT